MGLCGSFLPITGLHIGVSKLLRYSQVILGLLWLPWSLSLAESLHFGYSVHSDGTFLLSVTLSRFGYHFKAFEVILVEQPIILWTSLYVFPSPIEFFKSKYAFLLNSVWIDSFYSDFQREMHYNQHVQHLLPQSFNKGHFSTPVFFFVVVFFSTQLLFFNVQFLLNDSITRNQQHAYHDCWVC